MITSRVVQQRDGLSVLFESFAFKRGVPTDADFVFDARALPNPYWRDELRSQTGLDAEVIQFLENDPRCLAFFDKLKDFIASVLRDFRPVRSELYDDCYRLHWRSASLCLSDREGASRPHRAVSFGANSPSRPARGEQLRMEKTITVINPLGLHARPAAKVVDCAARFTSDIRINYQNQDIDAKSIMSVLMLAAPCGAELSVAISGR
jgi:phosphotransferase system HPr (HPr) family protein